MTEVPISGRAVRSLWTDLSVGAEIKVGGRGAWTVTPFWMARSRAVGGVATHKRLQEWKGVPDGRSVARALAEFTANAHVCTWQKGERTWSGTTAPVAVLGNTGTFRSLTTVRVPFHLGRFSAMCTLIDAATAHQWDLRVDPWRQWASWWTLGKNAYPMAVMAGMLGEVHVAGDMDPEAADG